MHVFAPLPKGVGAGTLNAWRLDPRALGGARTCEGRKPAWQFASGLPAGLGPELEWQELRGLQGGQRVTLALLKGHLWTFDGRPRSPESADPSPACVKTPLMP